MNWRALGTHWLTLAAVWALQALFFWPLLTPDGAARLYLDDRDFIGAFFNYYSFTAQELAAGRLALWNPWVFGGHPSLADLQSAVFSPLGLLWSLAIGGREASVHLVQLRAFLSYLLLSGGVYLLCWQLTRLPLAAAFGAIAFSLSSFAAFYPFTQTPILETLAWLPLTLFALERYARRGAPGWLAAAALSGSGLIFGGHAQTTLFAAATTACWLLYRWLTCRRQCAWTALPALLAFALLVAGLGAVQLLPALELIPLSNRAAITYEQAAVGFTPAALLGLALPDYLEGHSAYAGVLPLLLALLALLRGRGADRWFWLLLALGGALLSLGGNGPLYPLLHAGVPGFALFTHQERAIGLTVLAVAVLAAHGLALLWGRSRRSRGYGGIDLVAIALVAALAALAVALREPAASGAEGQWRYALSLALAGLLLLGEAGRGLARQHRPAGP